MLRSSLRHLGTIVPKRYPFKRCFSSSQDKLSLNAELVLHDKHDFPIPNLSLANADIQIVDASLKNSFICHPSESAWHIAQIQDMLTYLHDTTGLPWWTTIVTLTFAFRTIVLPLNISLVCNSARLNMLRPQLEELNKVLKDPKTTEEKRVEAAEQTIGLFKKYKCSPFRNILPPIMMTPVFLSVFMAWERTIVFTPSCQEGGTLWFENLAAVDVTFVLPVLSAMTWIATFRLGADRARSPAAVEFERFCTYLSLAMIPVTQTVPQGAFLYWISSNMYSMLLMFLTRLPTVRRLLNIPPRPPLTFVAPWKRDFDTK